MTDSDAFQGFIKATIGLVEAFGGIGMYLRELGEAGPMTRCEALSRMRDESAQVVACATERWATLSAKLGVPVSDIVSSRAGMVRVARRGGHSGTE